MKKTIYEVDLGSSDTGKFYPDLAGVREMILSHSNGSFRVWKHTIDGKNKSPMSVPFEVIFPYNKKMIGVLLSCKEFQKGIEASKKWHERDGNTSEWAYHVTHMVQLGWNYYVKSNGIKTQWKVAWPTRGRNG